MWPGPIDQASHDLYVETWHAHAGDTHRVDGPNAVLRVGCTMILAIAPTEDEALGIVLTGMDGSCVEPTTCTSTTTWWCPKKSATPRSDVARDHGSHGGCHSIRRRDCRADQGSLRRDPGARPHRLHRAAAPVGDMTLDEAKRTMDVFCSDVKPRLKERRDHQIHGSYPWSVNHAADQ